MSDHFHFKSERIKFNTGTLVWFNSVEHASMGWSRDEKTFQVKDPTSRLILVYPSSKAIGDVTEALEPSIKQPVTDSGGGLTKDLAALVCLRFEPEEDSDPDSLPVVYW